MSVPSQFSQKRSLPEDGNVVMEVDVSTTTSSVVIGTQAEITLPPNLYWNYVRPFTPIMDRPALNKRTGSTQFYAGNRAKLDEAFLYHQGTNHNKYILCHVLNNLME